jgi:hypothetical protein
MLVYRSSQLRGKCTCPSGSACYNRISCDSAHVVTYVLQYLGAHGLDAASAASAALKHPCFTTASFPSQPDARCLITTKPRHLICIAHLTQTLHTPYIPPREVERLHLRSILLLESQELDLPPVGCVGKMAQLPLRLSYSPPGILQWSRILQLAVCRLTNALYAVSRQVAM